MHNIVQKLKDNLLFEKLFFESKKIPLSEKIIYIYHKYSALLLKSSTIPYLGKKFSYDNPYTPALLQSYPYEIELIDKVIDLSKIKTVLDIGANVGQWGYTLKSFFPHIQLISFEPNTQVFGLLEQNATGINKWTTLPVGVGDPLHKTLYYTPNASAEGSVQKIKGAKKTPIELLIFNKKTRDKYSLPSHVDLVKIDVEGAEMDALDALKDLKYKYLCIEVAVTRKQGIKVKDVLKHIKNSKLLSLDVSTKDAPAGNALFKIGK